MAHFLDVSSGITGDLLSLMAAGVLLPVAGIKKYFGISYDPKIIKTGKIPILLIHGKGFNQIQWQLGRYCLSTEKNGSVFSLDYDGLVSNGDGKKIEDYAEVLSKKIMEIKEKTKTNQIILLGHSLGGLVASCYAENYAARDNIIVKHVITIATPWHEPPVMNYFKDKSMLYKQMTETFLVKMRENATKSITDKIRNYYTIGSTSDLIVPDRFASINTEIQPHMTFTYLGHYSLVASTKLWREVRNLTENFM